MMRTVWRLENDKKEKKGRHAITQSPSEFIEGHRTKFVVLKKVLDSKMYTSTSM